MKVLVIFSDPPGVGCRLRLDREDAAIARIARAAGPRATVERLHASEVQDVHALLTHGGFTVVQFSGHGSPEGLYLDRRDLAAGVGELVSAKRVVNLIGCANTPPLLLVTLCCYSDDSLKTLGKAAPFVITSKCEVEDDTCIAFVEAFYEYLLTGNPIQASYDHAIQVLGARGMRQDSFRLSRRCLLRRKGSVLVESEPDPARDSILVNLDAVADRLGSFGMSEEELCYLLAKKLRIHAWIFDGIRDRATIPIGRSLFGVFRWENAKDVVYCSDLLRLRSDTPKWQLECWSLALVCYNDLAACEYRQPTWVRPMVPDEGQRQVLGAAVAQFRRGATQMNAIRQVVETKDGFKDLLVHFALADAEIANAAEHLGAGNPTDELKGPQPVARAKVCTQHRAEHK
jgi:hypothetical protein